MSAHVFVAQSPFQVLSATEARHARCLPPDESLLVVLLPGEPRAVQQLRSIVGNTDWPQTRWMPARRAPLGTIRRVVAVRAEARRLRGTESVSIGEHRSPLMRHLANTAAADRAAVWLLDDGIATLLANEERALGQTVSADSPAYRNWSRKAAVARYVGLDQRDPDAVTFFSMYPLAVRLGDGYLRNEFSWLRSRMAHRRERGPAAFIGTSLVESGAITEDDYLRCVAIATERVDGDVQYVPHRREGTPKLRRLGSVSGVTITSLDGPIEYELALASTTPRTVVTFFSTALHSLRLVLGGQTEFVAFRLPADVVTPAWRDRVSAMYSSLGEVTTGVAIAEL